MHSTRFSCLFLILIFGFSTLSSSFFVEKKAKTVIQKSKIDDFLNLSAFKTKYVIDDVLALIQSLVDATQSEIKTLTDDWEASYGGKTADLAAIQDSLNSQTDACNAILNKINDLNSTITDIQDEIDLDNQKIIDNQAKIDSLLSSRCDSNRNYINSIKNNKQILNLVAILRQAINQFNETFIQEKAYQQIHSKLVLFLNRYTLKKGILRRSYLQTAQDLPDVQQRTTEEIGTGHIDNSEDQITVDDIESDTIDSLQSVKTHLLRILDDIEAQVNADTATYEANEIDADEKAAEVKLNLDTENTSLANKILSLQAELKSNLVDLDNKNQEYAQCEDAYNSFLNSWQAAQNDVNDATTYYNNHLNKLNEELALFQEVLNIYQSQIASASDKYKQRTDDWADDQTFNSAQDFGSRSAYGLMDSTN